jgi:hypothetical protein
MILKTPILENQALERRSGHKWLERRVIAGDRQ